MHYDRTDEGSRPGEPGDAARDIERDVTIIVARARRVLSDFVRDKPHAALAMAALAGFVVGGGMTPSRIMRWGVALGGPALSRAVLAKVAEILRDAVDGEDLGGGRFPGSGGEPAI